MMVYGGSPLFPQMLQMTQASVDAESTRTGARDMYEIEDKKCRAQRV